MTIQELRELKAKKIAEMKALLALDSRTEEQNSQWDTLDADVEKISADITKHEKLMDLTAQQLSDSSFITVNAQAPARVQIVNEPSIYKNLGEQLLDVRSMTIDDRDAPQARERFQKIVNAAAGASTGIDSEGGFLVETDRSSQIITTAIETGVFSSRCTRQPIGPNADSFSYLAADDRDRSTKKRNGIDVYRKSEYQTMVSSGKATLKERELRVEDMYGLIYVTNRMLRDATALASYAQRCLEEQFAFKLDYEIFQGTGVGQCLGITASDLPVSVAKVGSQTAATINATNITTMLTRFYGNLSKACWFVNQDTLSQYPLMTIGQQPVFMPGGQMVGAPYGTMLGLPIVPVEFCSTLGTKYDILLADFSQYLLVEKGGMEVAQSLHVKFLTDEMAYRFITRNNGQPFHDTPITPLNGSNTLSPFVTLDVRS